jgi:nicotinamide mononucleotide transporter PnuC
MLKNPFKKLNTLELCLWIFSLVLVILSFVLSPLKDYLTLVASLIGVTALIFVAKGMVIGQILTVVFSVFYGIISFFFAYYGEMITYLLMTTPIAILATVEWIKNPYKKTETVAIKKLTTKDIIIMVILCAIVTVAFYFILKAFNTANLIFSTISITTSFFACYLTYLRSPYYALAYACNDIVLIVLWVLATIENVAYIPMIVCFSTFLLNDLYGFFNWSKMQKKQSKNL